MHYTTNCSTQSSAPEDGRDQRPKHVELIGIINESLLLHLVGVYIICATELCNVAPDNDVSLVRLLFCLKSSETLSEAVVLRRQSIHCSHAVTHKCQSPTAAGCAALRRPCSRQLKLTPSCDSKPAGSVL